MMLIAYWIVIKSSDGIRLSSIPLAKEQESLLAHRPNFVITQKKPPLGDYISNIEKACQSLDTNTAEELRSEV